MAQMNEPRPAGAGDLRRRLERGLTEPARQALRAATLLADELGVALYLVGGPVRDLLLDRSPLDLDLVLPGDALSFARRLAADLEAEAELHERFSTARLRAPSGLAIDIAGARTETYPAPAALPEVRPSDLAADLGRRDFTVNALALRLAPGPAPTLVDEVGGLADLEHGLLRDLHPGSFRDDPTRILRGARLAARLGFRFEKGTASRAREAAGAGAFAPLSGNRLRSELELLLEDGGGAAPALSALGLLEEVGALAAILPGVELDDAVRDLLVALDEAMAWARDHARPPVRVERWRVRLLALVRGLTPRAAALLAERLALDGSDRDLVAGCGARLRRAATGLERAGLRPHEATAALAPLDAEELVLLAALGGAAGDWARRELAELRSFEIALSGGDLVARGHPPGPAIGGALAATRAARLDGAIDESGELEFALAELARREAAGVPATGGGSRGGRA